ncbi:MAG: aspartate aminotransferase family protein [Spirochaetaceae bacterium]|nr:aspartate aminotransferase family protein [Spirochaetaceae bacterium]
MLNSTPLLLTSDKKNLEIFKREIEQTVNSICESLTNDKAYEGLSPEQLQSNLKGIPLLPNQGLGFEKVLQKVSEIILPNFLRTSSTSYMAHLHSPALIESIAAELILSTFNQSMDSWDQSPIATEVEVEVVKQLCQLFDLGKDSDGVFTSGGSQSNLSGLFLARDIFCKNNLNWDVKMEGLPENYSKFKIYTSEISHFSMEKSAHLLGLGYKAVRKVPVDLNGIMDINILEMMIESDLANDCLPFCVVATLGTTDYGSIDNLDKISILCKKFGLWLHADAAYGSGLIVSSKYKKRLGNISLCDSITIDFHKMFLLPISCGLFLVKEAKNFAPLSFHADYLNREEDEEEGYVNLVGKSLQTTRRFDALKVWMTFQVRGKNGYSNIIDTCVENAQYLYNKLLDDKYFEVAMKPEISSLVFRLNNTDEVNKKIRKQLLHQEGIVIGQTVYNNKTFLKFTLLNPLVTHLTLDSIIDKIKVISN